MTFLQNEAFPYSERAQQTAILGGSCVLASVLFSFAYYFPSALPVK